MAAEINIPKEAIPDLLKIASLDDGAFTSFLSAIKETPPALGPIKFARLVTEKVALPEKEDLPSILRTLFVLFSIREKAEVSSEKLSSDIGDSAESGSKEFTPAKAQKLKERLKTLLEIEVPLGITSKAVDVMTEHERIFCGARVLSDIRPVFAGKPEKAEAAVIIHNLQIGFHQQGRHQEFYVALDTDDIQRLKEIIERAEKKTIALKMLLEKSGTPYMPV